MMSGLVFMALLVSAFPSGLDHTRPHESMNETET